MAGLTSLWSLEGRWHLARRIAHASGGEDRFEGVSRFSRSGPNLVQVEEGTLSLAASGVPLKATRRYVWTSAEGRIEVCFDDMRPFHTIPLGSVTPETTYLCPPDRYRVSYDFSTPAAWRSVWQVEGPRKAYRMETVFTPAS